MLQICMFGGYEGRLQGGKRVFFTLFGGSTLRKPTLARQILRQRGEQQAAPPKHRRHVVITLFGATEIKVPTLAEEFLDMREAIRSGTIAVDEWDRFVADLARTEDDAVLTVTLFGALGETELPEEDEEVDSLALQRHLGNIDDSAVRILQHGIGQDEAHRRAVLRQAVAASP